MFYFKKQDFISIMVRLSQDKNIIEDNKKSIHELKKLKTNPTKQNAEINKSNTFFNFYWLKTILLLRLMRSLDMYQINRPNETIQRE